MRKVISMILVLLFSTNLALAEFTNNTPNDSEIITYLNTYLHTYDILVNIQKDVNREDFFLYNKTLQIDIVVSEYERKGFEGLVSFVFNKVKSNESIYRFYRTNRSPDEIILHHKPGGDGSGTTVEVWWEGLYRDYWDDDDLKGNKEYFYYTLIINLERIKPEFAFAEAIFNFNEEYRDLIVKKTQKIAEENSFYENNYIELKEFNNLMHDRSRKGLYLDNRTLYKEDSLRFDELVIKSGLSEKEGEKYSILPIPKKEVLGIDGIEYKNNFYGYILPFFILMAVSTIFRIKLDKIKMETLEKYYDFISLPAIAVYFYAIKPFDIQFYEIFIILLIFIMFTIFILEYETKKEDY